MQAQASLVASLKEVSISICRAATWGFVHTFVRHYVLMQAAASDASMMSRAVLRSVMVQGSRHSPPLEEEHFL